MKQGRLKHSLRDKCPKCGGVLQVRVRGIQGMAKGMDIIRDEEFITCSLCDYEQESKQKRKRRKEFIPEF